MEQIARKIFDIKTEHDFNDLAMEVFSFQARNNIVYEKYLNLLKIKANEIKRIEDIPFLPIELFKSLKIYTAATEPSIIFESSGTTSSQTSRHFVALEDLYRKSFIRGFRHFYGKPESYTILALLPSYLERKNSSLVYMMNDLIKRSKMPESGFYLYNLSELTEVLEKRNNDHIPTILLGVSFALLDLAKMYPQKLSENITIMETGGMKGRKKEMIREELHETLRTAFKTKLVHSEYGMTEILSQAYSKGNGLFKTPPWMRILIRDLYDPFKILPSGKSGGINIIDLANLYSCSFISTSDAGVLRENGTFEVIGREDHSEIRGCNLMVI